MANDTSRRPWALDTAAVITADRVRIKTLRWVSPTTVDHLCQVEDSNGERIFDIETTGANLTFTESFGDGFDFQGFEVATIDSGILYVYLG